MTRRIEHLAESKCNRLKSFHIKSFFPKTFFNVTRLCRGTLYPIDDDRTKVIYICISCSRLEQIAKPGKEIRRIVVGEKSGWIEAKIFCPCEGPFINDSAGWVCCKPSAAIGAIGISGKDSDA